MKKDRIILQKIGDKIRPLKEGDTVKGRIIGLKRGAVFLDLSPFGTGIIKGKEFFDTRDELKKKELGEEILVKVINLDNKEGYIELSLKEASQEMAWDKLKKIKDNEETIKVKILGANKGGLLTNVFGIQAFLPSSQLSPENYPKVPEGNPNKILKELQKLVGKELEVKILDISPREGKLILSEKAFFSETSKETFKKSKETLKKYKVGDVVEGEITAVLDFGAFIKFWKEKGKDEMEGLIHISELEWQMIDHPSQVVKVGDKVKAKIVSIENDKIFLSLKALKENPWKKIEKKYKKGDIVEGTVEKIKPYGAFIKLEDKIYGLCHISEFKTIEKMKKELEEGKKYQFQIISFSPKEYKISLKLKK